MTHDKKVPSYKIVITTEENQQSQESVGEASKSLGEQMKSLSSLMFENIKFQTDQMQEFSKTFTEFTKAIMYNLQIDLQPQLRKIVRSLQKIVEPVQEDAKLAVPLLAEAEFWITPSMPLELLWRIRGLSEKENSTSENVETVIIKYYEQDNWLALKKTVETWGENKLFAKRMFIINDALDAHASGKKLYRCPPLSHKLKGF